MLGIFLKPCFLICMAIGTHLTVVPVLQTTVIFKPFFSILFFFFAFEAPLGLDPVEVCEFWHK